jgi:hypothetical protein
VRIPSFLIELSDFSICYRSKVFVNVSNDREGGTQRIPGENLII